MDRTIETRQWHVDNESDKNYLGAEGLKAALSATDDSTKSTHSNSEIDGKLFFPIFSPVKN